MLPILSVALAGLMEKIGTGLEGQWKKILSLEKYFAAFLLMIAVIFFYLSFSNFNYRKIAMESTYFPVGSVQFLRMNHVFWQYVESLYWGGYLAFKLYPDYRISMDGRDITAYPVQAVLDNFSSETVDDYNKILQKYNVNFVLTDSEYDAKTHVTLFKKISKILTGS